MPKPNLDNRGRLLPAAPCFRMVARCDSFLAKVIEPCPDAESDSTTSYIAIQLGQIPTTRGHVL